MHLELLHQPVTQILVTDSLDYLHYCFRSPDFSLNGPRPRFLIYPDQFSKHFVFIKQSVDVSIINIMFVMSTPNKLFVVYLNVLLFLG